MSSYTLTNTAADIDSAIARVVTADSAPIDNSSNMVTSGGVKQYFDEKITTLNTQISNLSQDITTVSESERSFGTGYSTLSASGTAPSDGFILAQNYSSSGTRLSWLKVVAAGITFEDRIDAFNFGRNRKHNLCVPIAKGESYAVSRTNGSIVVRFKSINQS